MLEIFAGKEALKTLQTEGFTNEVFSAFLGASGGPKWFSLFGLDKYLFGEFFKDRQQTLSLIGSSAGAFRAACFAQADPVAAISRLAKYYSETVYADKVTPAEITQSARVLLKQVLGTNGAAEIINNDVFKAHFIVAKANGLVASEQKALQLAGLVKSYAMNRLSRRLLNKQYERYVYHTPNSNLQFHDESEFTTHYVNLTERNLADALLASGSIPMVMQGIKNIPDSPPGMYRDGGIIDYHFDIKLENQRGLTLYPHFNSNPKAGWFDKSLKRKVNPRNYANTVMLVPSAQFIASLPYGKIPDREDFTKLATDDRIKYWRTVLSETERLAEAFNHFLVDPNLSLIHPI
ncbi:patatin-like phospholipase family protein [Flavobacterium sp. W21_SRS_FM6]|uniref:patatin-like phospholipase family protein n=1 Tax=Flavobacterium sp. W21_SRS_FM6 TaxID=3240268 RepID=UPI003F91AA7C